MKSAKTSTVAVFGLGYVGCVTAVCLARLGHRVIGVDKDTHKVNDVRQARAPFYEPGLEELIQSAVKDQKLLTATESAAEAIADADVALICVGTPSARNGNLDVTALRAVASEIAPMVAGRTKPLVVAVRSTVFPGTCETVLQPLFEGMAHVKVVSNPEFLREGCAVKDFMEPSLVVVGGHDRQAVESVAGLYDALGVAPCLVKLRTAEMIKYACNAFHAVKIAFANEVGSLAAELDVSGEEVMATLCKDDRLNTSAAYLKPGFAFGGSCLPKDLRALQYRSQRLDVDIPMLANVLASNDAHLQRAVDLILDLPGKIGVMGLAFKENTDDLRESPVVTMLEHLIGKGRAMKVWDPHIQLDVIYGANKNFILNAIPHIGQLLVPSLKDVTGWADTIVVTQKPSAEILKQLEASGVQLIHLWDAPRKVSAEVAEPA
jgi:GDP-mannose 6-dehydrogenase